MIKTFPFKSCLWKNAAQNPFSIKKLSAQNPGTILCSMVLCRLSLVRSQGGITCGAIDEPRKSSKAIDERVIINFRDKNVVIARFRDKNVYR